MTEVHDNSRRRGQQYDSKNRRAGPGTQYSGNARMKCSCRRLARERRKRGPSHKNELLYFFGLHLTSLANKQVLFGPANFFLRKAPHQVPLKFVIVQVRIDVHLFTTSWPKAKPRCADLARWLNSSVSRAKKLSKKD
jgi:hypothetical protein